MATEIKYKEFRLAFEAEEKRLSELVNRAKVYLTLLTFFLGALVFKFDTLPDVREQEPASTFFYMLSTVLLFIALILSVLSLRILSYEIPFNPRKYIEEELDEVRHPEDADEKEPPDEDFLDNRMVDLTIATERNLAANNKRATLLEVAGWFVIAGFAATLMFVGLFIKGH